MVEGQTFTIGKCLEILHTDDTCLFSFLFAKPNIPVDPSNEDRLLSCICSLLIWDEIPEAKVYGVVFYYLVGDHGSFILQLLVIRVFTH